MTRSRMMLVASFSLVTVTAALALSTFVLGPARAAVGPLPAEALALPADTRVLMGFDVPRLLQSPLYARLRGQAGQDPFAELRAKLGVDPERDLDTLVIASGGRAGAGGPVVMAFGRFDRYALGRALEGRKGVTWKSSGGTTLYLFDEQSRTSGALAFLADDAVVAGPRASVEQVLASQQGGGEALRANARLMTQIGRIKPGSAFWLAGDQSALGRLPLSMPAPGAAPGSGAQLELPALQGLTATGELSPLLSLDVVGDAADAAAANKLADVVRGLVALATLQASHKPELQELASALSVTTEREQVRLALRLRYELLDKLSSPAKPAVTAKVSQ